MTIFKTFWNVVKKYKGTILLYTILLIVFGGINMTAQNPQTSFTNEKPDIYIKNEDKKGLLANNLVKYMKKKSHIVTLDQQKDSIQDALFYREVNYIIEIPKNYSKNIMAGKEVEIKVQSTKDYQASLAELILKRYLKLERLYQKQASNEEEVIQLINQNLSQTSKIEISSKLDRNKIANASRYFSFASYSIMAVIIFVICLVISSFQNQGIKKRTIISSKRYQEYNLELLLSSILYSFLVWILFVIVGILLLGDIMFTSRGVIYMINSLLFTFCCLTIALVITTLVRNKNAVNGIVNVVALGSAFLCGAFVPAEYLPEFVLKIAKGLPAYWYIHTNDILKTLDKVNLETMRPIFINFLMIIGFSFLFVIINNIISRYKQKEN